MRQSKKPAAVVAAVAAVKYLGVASKEGKSFLSDAQYWALVEEVKQLADFPSGGPLSAGLDIKRIDGFFELREKGGIFGKINVRVFFGLIEKTNTVWIVGAIKKEAEDQTPRHIVIRMHNRLRELNRKFQ